MFRTYNGGLRIAVMEEILCGKEIRVCRVRRLLPVCRKLRKKIIIKGAALRAFEERVSALVVLPEDRQIVVHL